MTRYVLTIWQPDGPPPPNIDDILRDLDAWTADAKTAGAWLFDGGLAPPSTSTVVRPAEPLITDGPYVEGKEHIGGFVIIRADDLDAALGWARRLTTILGLPIEVRPYAE